MTAATAPTVAAWPGTEPRLLRHGFRRPATRPARTLRRTARRAAISRSRMPISCWARSTVRGLLGRGGAAFPLAVKLRAVRDNGRRRGGAVGDRQRRGGRARVGQGPLAAAAPPAPGARRAAVGGPHRRRGSRLRLRLRSGGGRTLSRRALAEVDPAVLTGSRSASSRSSRLRRGRGNRGGARAQRRPGQTDRQAPAPVRRGRRRPSHPGEQCRDAGEPAVPARGTARGASVAAAPRRRRERSWRRSRGPAVRRRSTRFRTGWRSPNCSALHGVPTDQVDGVLMGGYFAGLVNRDVLSATLDHETPARPRQRARLRRDLDPHRRLPGRRRCRGDGLLRPRERGPVRLLLQRHRGDVGGHRRRCATGLPTADDLARLQRWSVVLRGRGACATLDGATNIAASLLAQFPELVASHLDSGCRTCLHGAFSALRPVRSGGGDAGMKIRLDRTLLRRVRHLRQARARVLLARRLGIRVADRRRQVPPADRTRSRARCWTARCTRSSKWATTSRGPADGRCAGGTRTRPENRGSEAISGFVR